MKLIADTRNLPDPVVARLAPSTDLAAPVDGLQAVQNGRMLEARRFARPIETRQLVTDSDPEFEGYAAVWDVPYPVMGGPEAGGWLETMKRGAATKTLSEGDAVKLLFDHEGLPLASTAGATLTVVEDDIGLMALARFDRRSTFGMDVAYALDRRDLDTMSMAFQVLRQTWANDYTERVISEFRLYDVSVVSYPAQPATVAAVRSQKPRRAMSLGYAQALAAKELPPLLKT